MSQSAPTQSSLMTKACVLHGPKDLRLEEQRLPEPSPTEVQVKIARVGLCGSDLHYYSHYANGAIQVKEPLILGHEGAGVVAKIGSDVQGLAVGDMVALEVGVPCDICDLCVLGRYNLCPNLRFRSSAKSFPHYQGLLQDRVNHPARWCHKLPEGMTADQAALLEPLAVALHACHRASLSPIRSKMLVIGAGAIGLLVALCLKVRGHFVVIADIASTRLRFAELHGYADATVLLPSRRGRSTEEDLEIAQSNQAMMCEALPHDIPKHSLHSGSVCPLFDTVFECTGVQSCVQAGIFSAKAGGKVVLVGMGQTVQTLQMSAAALREVDIIGVFRYAGNYTEGLQMFLQGQLENIERLITHRIQGMQSIQAAFETASRTQDDDGEPILKVLIELNALC